ASSLRSVPRLSRGGRLTGRGARAVPIAFRGYNWLTSRMEYLMTAATTASKGLNKGPIPVGKENQSVTVPDFLAAKARGGRLTMLTAYDYTMARLLDAAGVDGLLVGDSLGMVVQGHENSLSVTLEEVLYHTRCVARGVRRSLLVADMPFMTYHISPQQAL